MAGLGSASAISLLSRFPIYLYACIIDGVDRIKIKHNVIITVRLSFVTKIPTQVCKRTFHIISVERKPAKGTQIQRENRRYRIPGRSLRHGFRRNGSSIRNSISTVGSLCVGGFDLIVTHVGGHVSSLLRAVHTIQNGNCNSHDENDDAQ